MSTLAVISSNWTLFPLCEVWISLVLEQVGWWRQHYSWSCIGRWVDFDYLLSSSEDHFKSASISETLLLLEKSPHTKRTAVVCKKYVLFLLQCAALMSLMKSKNKCGLQATRPVLAVTPLSTVMPLIDASPLTVFTRWCLPVEISHNDPVLRLSFETP